MSGDDSNFQVASQNVTVTLSSENGLRLAEALAQDGRVEWRSAGTISISHDELAELQPWELLALDLPPAAPYRLEIRGTGAISSSSFRLHVQLKSHDGRKVLGAQRVGAVLIQGRWKYTLLNPLYQVLVAAEAFAEGGPGSIDDRFRSWAEIKGLLPEDAIVDQQLQTINLVRADGFTLDVRPDGAFDPVPLSRPLGNGPADDVDPGPPDEPLPESYQQTLAERFRQLPGARGHYALGGGWYVAVPEPTRKALEIVHKKQRASRAERQAFIANPQRELGEALRGEVAESVVEQLFVEMPRFLSGRVQCLGEWQPKLGAYVQSSGNQWLPEEERAFEADTRLGVAVGGKYVSFSVEDAPEIVQRIEAAIETGDATIEINGAELEANEESLAAFRRFVRQPEGVENIQVDDGKSSADKQPQLVPILLDNIDEVGYVAKQREVQGEPGGLPSILKTRGLFPHQQEGVHWLQSAWISGAPGALLADDMGLGKTLQTLAFLGWLQEQIEAGYQRKKPFLIVAPTGLLKNWEAEAKTHLLGIGLGELIRAYGTELRELLEKGVRQRTKDLQGCDWAMTTYETLRDRIEVFLPVDWTVVAFDECQKIKNPGSRVTEMAKSLKADFTLTITGTPVENSLRDLWSIMDASRPGFLGSLKAFSENYQKPAEEDGDISVGRRLRMKLEEETKPPAILRRMKEEHLSGLPERLVNEMPTRMSAVQSEAYSGVVAAAVNGRGNKGAMLKALQEMRRVSLLAQPLGDSGLTDEHVQGSARLQAAMRALEEIRSKGEKALIFLEYLDLQEALAPYLQQRFGLLHPPMRISGKVSGATRQRHVDTFQNRPEGVFDIMLLSPRAGGVGITLTAANHVIHLSRWWNPAVEDQCTDRVFRIGQKRAVQIHYPLAVHPEYGDVSFDLNLHRLLEKKRSLSRSVLAPPDVSDGELSSLFDETVTPAPN